MNSPNHKCRRGTRCKTRTRTADGKVHGGGIERPGLCDPCEDTAFTAINELASDWDRLDNSLSAVSSGGVPQIGGTNAYPVPIRLDVESIRAAIETEVIRWARVVTRGNIELPAHIGRCVTRCVATLRTHTGTLIDQPTRTYTDLEPLPDGGDRIIRVDLDGVDAVLRLADLHKRAVRAVGETDTRVWLPDPCPHCGRKTLAPSKDQSRVSCHSCRIVWDSDHFALLSNVLDFERKRIKA